MVDSYIKVNFEGVSDHDTIVGLLNDLPFTGFEELDGDLLGYMTNQDWTEAMENKINALIAPFVDNIGVEKIPFENWNHQWEEDYPEVEIDDFCRIYAPFHSGPSQKFKYEILISPQMAFGTGHHATTEMMIRLMSHLPEKIHDCEGLDFGSGSGILAILASRMGASSIDAIEIDDYAYQNLVENIRLNNGDWIKPYHGGIETISEQTTYDFIVANVTKNIILTYAQDFYQRLNPGGRIIVSGILNIDQDEVVHAYIQAGFFGLESMKIGKWTALMFGVKS